MPYPAQGIREVQDRFTWGEVLDVIVLPLGKKGEDVTFIKHHPWKVTNAQVRTGDPDRKVVQWHCEETSWGNHSLDEALVRYMAHKNLGLNQHHLVEGVMRALAHPHFVPENG